MTRFATGLAARGINVVTFNFLYTEEDRRVPYANKALEACFRAVIEAVSAVAGLRVWYISGEEPAGNDHDLMKLLTLLSRHSLVMWGK